MSVMNSLKIFLKIVFFCCVYKLVFLGVIWGGGLFFFWLGFFYFSFWVFFLCFFWVWFLMGDGCFYFGGWYFFCFGCNRLVSVIGVACCSLGMFLFLGCLFFCFLYLIGTCF